MGKLEYFRRINKLSQTELALKLGITKVYYNRLEKKKVLGAIPLWILIQKELKLTNSQVMECIKENYSSVK